jgi:enoyl-CoA hydratase
MADPSGQVTDRAERARPLVVAERFGAVELVTIQRPEARNALSPELMRVLAETLEAADRDSAVACIVLAGSEQAFSAGADLGWLTAQPHDKMMRFGAGDWPRIRAIRTPRVAAVSGWATGGGFELALSCDMIVASETALFALPEIGLGIVPGAGGMQALARLVGRPRAMELVLTGRSFDASEASELGIVTRVVPPADWLRAAMKLGAEVAEKPALAVSLAAESVRSAASLTNEDEFSHQRRVFELALATDDAREGLTAAVEKRAPRFRSLSKRS